MAIDAVTLVAFSTMKTFKAGCLFGCFAVLVAPGLQAQTQWVSPADEINSKLPKWFQFNGEFRSRFEGVSAAGFKPNNSDAYWLTRLRLGFTIRPTSWIKLYAEGQDARAMFKQPGQPPFENVWDIRQGYAELGQIDKGMFALRIGRQELSYGDQRLIGPTPWTNAGRTFDAVRGQFNRGGYKVELFAASVVNAVNDTWDHHQDGNNLHGARLETKNWIPNANVETYVYWRTQPGLKTEAGAAAKLNEKIPGLRIAGKFRQDFDYDTEMLRETGTVGTDSIHAWAGHWAVGHTSPKMRWKPRVFAEFNYASGDANPKDGIRGTFDQLYPSAHDKTGLADQVAWKNIRDFRTGVETKPVKNVTANVVLHNWNLANKFDGLYTTANAITARSATGTAGTHVGEELDIQGSWTISKPLQANFGIGHIFPGEFLRKTTPGNGYTFPYLMLLYKF